MKKNILPIILFITSTLFAQYTTPGTGVNWSLDDLVTNSAGTVTGTFPNYTINELVTVSANDKINIAPGVIVSFTTANSGFEVNGSFMAIGTNLTEITFTSPTPDSTGAYEGFRFNDTSVDAECIFNYVRTEYAYYGLRAIDASPTISNSILYKCRRGVQLSTSDAIIIFNTITNCYEYGITMTLGSSPLIENNVLQFNNTQASSAKNQISIGLQGNNSPVIKGNTIHGGSGTVTGGISVWVSGGSNFSNAVIENNFIYNNSFGIALLSTSNGIMNTVIKNNTIYDNNVNPDPMVSGSGININGSTFNQPVITRNNIYGNWWGITIQNGSVVQAGPQPNIGNIENADTSDDGWNIIHDNLQGMEVNDLFNNCTNDIYAQNNDWGVYDSLSIENHVFHNADDPSHGTVFFIPFWTGVVPVELVSFNASVSENSVTLKWITATETNNLGFVIKRNDNIIDFVRGSGTSFINNNYEYYDSGLREGHYLYQLIQEDFDGTKKMIGTIETDISPVVSEFKLEQNYPNPFNPTTKIKYTIPTLVNKHAYSLQVQIVTLKVYDILGRQVATLINEVQPTGEYEVEFDASELTSGVYFYQLHSGDFIQTRKMLLMK